MTKVVKKEKAEVVVIKMTDDMKSWGDSAVDARDILIPKLFVLNPMSKLCVEDPDTYRPGSIIRSTDKKVVADSKNSISFIPIMDTKVWKVSKSVGTKFEFVRFEPYNRTNADLPWSWEEGPVKWRRDTTVNVFCLLPADIIREQEALAEFHKGGDLPDTDDVMLPVCVSFSRTSYSSFKTLATNRAKCEQMGFNQAVTTFKLQSRKETKDDNTWYVLDVEKFERTPTEFLGVCRKWYDTISKTNANVDEAGEEAVMSEEKVYVVSDNF